MTFFIFPHVFYFSSLFSSRFGYHVGIKNVMKNARKLPNVRKRQNIFLYSIYGHVSRTGDKSGGLGQIGKLGRYFMGFLYITDKTLVHLCGKLGTEI